jgi:hypothetical protein
LWNAKVERKVKGAEGYEKRGRGLFRAKQARIEHGPYSVKGLKQDKN